MLVGPDTVVKMPKEGVIAPMEAPSIVPPVEECVVVNAPVDGIIAAPTIAPLMASPVTVTLGEIMLAMVRNL